MVGTGIEKCPESYAGKGLAFSRFNLYPKKYPQFILLRCYLRSEAHACCFNPRSITAPLDVLSAAAKLILATLGAYRGVCPL